MGGGSCSDNSRGCPSQQGSVCTCIDRLSSYLGGRGFQSPSSVLNCESTKSPCSSLGDRKPLGRMEDREVTLIVSIGTPQNTLIEASPAAWRGSQKSSPHASAHKTPPPSQPHLLWVKGCRGAIILISAAGSLASVGECPCF